MQATPWTFFLLKPDAVRRGLEGEILRRVEGAGFRLRSRLCVRFDRAVAEEFYTPYTFAMLGPRRRRTVEHTVSYLIEGECLGLVVESSGAPFADIFARSNALKGEHFVPERCARGSLRFDLRDGLMVSSIVHCDVPALTILPIDHIVYNLVHAPKHAAERDHQFERMTGLARRPMT